MPLPFLSAGAQIGGKLLGGISDIIGGDRAAAALKKAQGKARSDLTQGYGQAQGYQRPIYDTGLKNYTNLSNDYASGRFANPHMDAYRFDPQSVFQDPEYQASLRAGTDTLDASASKGSMLFSGQHAKDLQQFGQDTFAKRSDMLYDRGFNAQNTAFNQNAMSNLNNFNMGQNLVQPLSGAASNLSNLAMNQGQDLANNSLGSGQIRAGNILRTSNALGGMAGDVGSGAADYLLGKGTPSVRQPRSRL